MYIFSYQISTSGAHRLWEGTPQAVWQPCIFLPATTPHLLELLIHRGSSWPFKNLIACHTSPCPLASCSNSSVTPLIFKDKEVNVNEIILSIIGLCLSPELPDIIYLSCISLWSEEVCEDFPIPWVFCVPWKVPGGLGREGHIEMHFVQTGKPRVPCVN